MAKNSLEYAFELLRNQIKNGAPVAIAAAQKAAIDVHVRAAKQAAPVKTGQLKESIKLMEGRPDGQGQRRMYIGPEKKKGYYGYFVEKGHRSHIRRINGKIYSKRIARKSTNVTHSQSGESTPTHDIPARPWFEPAMKRVENQAVWAAEEAFYRIMNQKGS